MKNEIEENGKKTKEKINKYKNKKIEKYGHKFDSEMELNFYESVCLPNLETSYFKSVELQKNFVLQDGFRRPYDDKLIRPVLYKADFVIELSNGKFVIIDIKGQVLETFKIKWKMLMHKYRDDDRYIFKCIRGRGRNVRKGQMDYKEWIEVY